VLGLLTVELVANASELELEAWSRFWLHVCLQVVRSSWLTCVEVLTGWSSQLLPFGCTFSLVSLEGGSPPLAHVGSLKEVLDFFAAPASSCASSVFRRVEACATRALERQARTAPYYLDKARVRAALSHTTDLAPATVLPLDVQQHLRTEPLPPEGLAAGLPPRVPRPPRSPVCFKHVSVSGEKTQDTTDQKQVLT
jgi:hypothetical protein